MPIKVVFFDVGETLVDETRLWKGWAAYLGVPTNEFLRVLHETIERGDDHRCALEHFKPGLDLAAARQERESSGCADLFDERDLYPDARPSILSLRSAGYRVGIAGNQPMQAEAVLARIGLQVDLVASSARWGVAKPHRQRHRSGARSRVGGNLHRARALGTSPRAKTRDRRGLARDCDLGSTAISALYTLSS
jgi:FMN phosphatase YigB (HAD superfamily)